MNDAKPQTEYGIDAGLVAAMRRGSLAFLFEALVDHYIVPLYDLANTT